jgi:hypothetical protein
VVRASPDQSLQDRGKVKAASVGQIRKIDIQTDAEAVARWPGTRSGGTGPPDEIWKNFALHTKVPQGG